MNYSEISCSSRRMIKIKWVCLSCRSGNLPNLTKKIAEEVAEFKILYEDFH